MAKEVVRVFELAEDERGEKCMYPLATEIDFGSDSNKAKKFVSNLTREGNFAVMRVVEILEVKEVPKPVMEAKVVDSSQYKELFG